MTFYLKDYWLAREQRCNGRQSWCKLENQKWYLRISWNRLVLSIRSFCNSLGNRGVIVDKRFTLVWNYPSHIWATFTMLADFWNFSFEDKAHQCTPTVQPIPVHLPVRHNSSVNVRHYRTLTDILLFLSIGLLSVDGDLLCFERTFKWQSVRWVWKIGSQTRVGHLNLYRYFCNVCIFVSQHMQLTYM